MRNVAAGGGPVLLLTPPLSLLATSSSYHGFPAPASASVPSDAPRSKANSSPCACGSRTGALPSLSVSMRRNKRRGRRFLEIVITKASQEDEAETNNDAERDQEGPVDWDKAWSSFSNPSSSDKSNKKKKTSFLNMDMEQYVSRRPNHSNYPLSEEVDPLRKSERSALGAWTSPKFTYAVVGVIIGLMVYMVIIVGPPPNH